MDVFGIDDLLDFSNDQLFISSTSTTATAKTATTITTTDPHNNHHYFSYLDNPTTSNFTDRLCIPNDDIAELEWLSNFVDESSSEIPAYSVTGTMNVRSDTSFNTSKRSRSTTTTENTKTLNPDSNVKDLHTSRVSIRRERSPPEMSPRKCTHCSSEKTPQWRTGPSGPKTLCNACGVRYKSGRLVPEYRPAASPTFVLTQHSNSHRKVMELRRQKELYRERQQQEQLQLQETYGNPNRRFQVC